MLQHFQRINPNWQLSTHKLNYKFIPKRFTLESYLQTHTPPNRVMFYMNLGQRSKVNTAGQ